MTSNSEQLAARVKRFRDVVELRQPDQVPVLLNSIFWIARNGGLTCEQGMKDYDGVGAALRKALSDLSPDGYRIPHMQTALAPTMDILDYKQLKWPGQDGVGTDVSYQYLDREYMAREEWDDFIFDPTGFMLHTYLPRIAGAFEGLAGLPNIPSSIYFVLMNSMARYADPAVEKSLLSMIEAGKEMQKMHASMMASVQEAMEMGFPPVESTAATTPFDFFADFFRGSKGMMLDMYRCPDKLHEAMEKAIKMTVDRVIEDTLHAPNRNVFIALHWGLDGFMSPDQFNTFYWPPLKKMLEQLILADVTPCVLWEGNCTSRLETIKDIPAGKCVYAFEQTDMFKAKEILGDTVCIQGNVPASMLVTGTPEDVDDYCKKLIEVCGKGGGFILDGATAGVPDDAKYENVKAMFDAAKKYGVYS
jgi:uroporphyrinogen-III decarboxylase